MQVVDMQESDRELNLLAERNKTLFNAIASSTYPEDYFERCLQTRVLVKKFNDNSRLESKHSAMTEVNCTREQTIILAEIFNMPIQKALFISFRAPFHIDYGPNVEFKGIFGGSYGCVITGTGKITIGNSVMFGPNVQLLAESYPIDASQRRACTAEPASITVGDDVWLGAGAVIVGPCKIGNAVTVAAGAVVDSDIPDNVVVAGVPAKIIRHVDPPPPFQAPANLAVIADLAQKLQG